MIRSILGKSNEDHTAAAALIAAERSWSAALLYAFQRGGSGATEDAWGWPYAWSCVLWFAAEDDVEFFKTAPAGADRGGGHPLTRWCASKSENRKTRRFLRPIRHRSEEARRSDIFWLLNAANVTDVNLGPGLRSAMRRSKCKEETCTVGGVKEALPTLSKQEVSGWHPAYRETFRLIIGYTSTARANNTSSSPPNAHTHHTAYPRGWTRQHPEIRDFGVVASANPCQTCPDHNEPSSRSARAGEAPHCAEGTWITQETLKR